MEDPIQWHPNKQLKTIPQVESNVTHLNLSTNLIQELQLSRLVHLQSIQILNLSGNQLQSVQGIEKLRTLQQLDLSNNALVEIPNGFSKLKHLKYLYLQHNQIDSIGTRAFLKTKLVVLDLSFNQLSYIPACLGYLPLTKLVLYPNPLDSVYHDLVVSVCANEFVEPFERVLEHNVTMKLKMDGSQVSLVSQNSFGQPRLSEREFDLLMQLKRDTTRVSLSEKLESESNVDVQSKDSQSLSDRHSLVERQSDRKSMVERQSDLERQTLGSESLTLVNRKQTMTPFVGPLEDRNLERLLWYLRDEFDLLYTQEKHEKPDRSYLFDKKPTQLFKYEHSYSIIEYTNDQKQIIHELLQTEYTYVKELQSIFDLYLPHLDLENKEIYNILFCNLDQLLHLHQQEFMPRLVSCVGNSRSVGHLMAWILSFFDLYSTFFNQCVISFDFMQFCKTQSGNYVFPRKASAMFGAVFTKVSQKDAQTVKVCLEQTPTKINHSQLDLQAYLLLPVQRLPRYKLLMSCLLEKTDPSNLEYDLLQHTLVKLSEKIEWCNEQKRLFEQHCAHVHQLSSIKIPRTTPGLDILVHIPPGRRYMDQFDCYLLKMVKLNGRQSIFQQEGRLGACQISRFLGPLDLPYNCQTHGLLITLCIFNDMLLFISKGQLLLVMGIGHAPFADCHCELKEQESVLRITDGFTILYLRADPVSASRLSNLLSQEFY